MSKRAYVAAITLFTTGGLALASYIAFQTLTWVPASLWVYLGIGLGIPIVGIVIAFTSKNWLVSLFGYALVVCGLGAIAGPTVALYKTGIVLLTMVVTGGVTLVMSAVGIMYPKSLESWGGYLFGGLTALILMRFGQGVMAGMGMPESIWYMPWIEYGAVVLFSLYIIFDWNRAMRLPKTLDNAVDSSVAIFLDVFNLFFDLLRILGGSGSSSSKD